MRRFISQSCPIKSLVSTFVGLMGSAISDCGELPRDGLISFRSFWPSLPYDDRMKDVVTIRSPPTPRMTPDSRERRGRLIGDRPIHVGDSASRISRLEQHRKCRLDMSRSDNGTSGKGTIVKVASCLRSCLTHARKKLTGPVFSGISAATDSYRLAEVSGIKLHFVI